MPMAPRPHRRARVAASCAALVLASCGGKPPATLERYCGLVQDNLTAINSPTLATADDVERTLDLYRQIAGAAPLGVAQEWGVLVASFETASTVVVNDPASVAAAHDAALAGQPAYTRIQQYTATQCGTNIGVPPPPTNPAVTTTPPTSDSGA